MRILVNDIAASKTGALAILQDFYSYVKNNEKQHEWIFLTGGDYIEESENIKVIIREDVKSSQKNRLKFDLINGSKYIESLEPDVIFSLQNTLTRGKIRRLRDKSIDGVIRKKGEKIPEVLYVHQPLGFQKIKRFSFFNSEEREYAVYQYLIGTLIDFSVRKADRVIVQTQWMKEAVAEKTKKSDNKIFRVLPEVADLSAYKKSNTEDVWNRNSFFFPSGEILYKNHECAIKAAKILNDRGYKDFNIRFTLKALSDVTKRTYEDPYNNITWTGRVERGEVLEQYNQSTLLFPSYIETFGVPMAEARQLGTMILASDCPFSHEVLEGYENAYYFDPFSPVQLADLMEKVMTGKLNITRGGFETALADSENSYSKIVEIITKKS